MANIELHWQQAKELPQNKRHRQAVALNDFRNSLCDLFDIQDWLYISEATGWTIEKLRQYAKYDTPNQLNSMVYSLLGSELNLDDLYTFDF
tara:strand:+ start:816 stop:1088 length:273 start_codon:yes stop_codon:yes gene_type:complete